MRQSAFLAVRLALAPCAAWADPALECGLGDATQVAIADCLARTEADVDKTIAEALGFAQDSARSLDGTTGRPAALPALDGAQAAWSAYRDAHCAFVGETFGGGSGTGVAIRACRIDLGRERVAALMRFSG